MQAGPFARILAAGRGPFVFWSVAAVLVFYNVYRYPFRISDSTASTTYRDTPFELQAAKYVVLAALAALLVDRLPRIRWSPPNVLLAVLALYAAVRGIFVDDRHTYFDIVAPFFAGVPFALLLRARDVAVPAVIAAAGTTVVLHALADLVQIYARIVHGRLPALGRSSGLNRFGGLWDDPNSVALFAGLASVAVLACAAWTLRTRVVVSAALVVVTVAVSLSALAGLLVAVVTRARGRPAYVVTAVAVAAASAAVVLTLPQFEVKRDSLRTRLVEGELVDLPDNLLVGASEPRVLENAYFSWIQALGVVGVGLLVAWLVVALRRATPREVVVPIAAGFLVASLFVPYTSIFPVATMFVLFLGLTTDEAVSTPDPARNATGSGPRLFGVRRRGPPARSR